MNIKDMPFTTAADGLALREAAIQLEAEVRRFKAHAAFDDSVARMEKRLDVVRKREKETSRECKKLHNTNRQLHTRNAALRAAIGELIDLAPNCSERDNAIALLTGEMRHYD